MTFSRSRSFRSARLKAFRELVQAYERAFGRMPFPWEMRIFFHAATREAYPHGLA